MADTTASLAAIKDVRKLGLSWTLAAAVRLGPPSAICNVKSLLVLTDNSRNIIWTDGHRWSVHNSIAQGSLSLSSVRIYQSETPYSTK
jgi:hypothetical protein